MPALANATDISKGVVLARVRINRSQPSIGGEVGSAARLAGAGLKREDRRPADSAQTASGQRSARRHCSRRTCQWMDCRHHAPTSIAPSSMVVTDCRAGSFALPSEAACVFHLLYNAHKQVFSLRILDYGNVRAARSWTQLSRTHSFSMSFHSTRL
jgi:hypothetical protein